MPACLPHYLLKWAWSPCCCTCCYSCSDPTSPAQYCLSDKPEIRPFDPVKTCEQEYPVTEYQPVYFVADSFESAKQKVRCVCV